MATNNVHVSEELLAQLELTAAADGKTVNDVAESSIRKALAEKQWQDLLAYGLETGTASGYTEADVPALARARRRINAQGR